MKEIIFLAGWIIANNMSPEELKEFLVALKEARENGKSFIFSERIIITDLTRPKIEPDSSLYNDYRWLSKVTNQ